MTYTKQTWVNGPTGTPINADRLNYIESGIEAAAIISPEEADNLAASAAFSGRYAPKRPTVLLVGDSITSQNGTPDTVDTNDSYAARGFKSSALTGGTVTISEVSCIKV